jgi:transcriptional regulator with XRE-family HTH domain
MFGKRLAHERKRLGLSQEALAPRLSITRSALAMIETDRAPLDVERLVYLAGAVGLDPIYVITGQTSHVAACKLMDWDLVMEIQKGISGWSKKHKINLSPEEQTLALKILYERFSQSRGDINEAVTEVLSKVA